MRGFGRSIAFASAAFIGSEGLISVVRASIGQAETLLKAHRSLDTSVTRLGGNFRIASHEIDAWAKTQQRFGVTITESEQGLSRLIPLTGSVSTAMEAYSLALKLSKGDNVDLSAAETAVAKALDGKTASLQRYGIVLGRHATAEQAAAAISARFGGQAAANTTTLDKLHATLGNLELTLGQDALPTMEHVAGSLEKWFSNQQNVNRVTSDAKTVIGDATTVVKTAYDWAEKISGALGGWKDTLELLLGLKMAMVVGGWAQSLGFFSSSLAGETGAVTASGKLLANIRSLAAFGGMTFGITFDIVEVKRIINDFFGKGTPTAGETQYVGAKYGGSVLAALGGSSDAALLEKIASGKRLTAVERRAVGLAIEDGNIGSYATVAAARAAQSGTFAMLGKGTSSGGRLRSGYVTQGDMQSLLEQQGVPPAAAQILAGVAYKGESGGRTNPPINVNSNGTYDAGLFQINSSHKPASMTDAQWKAYLANPANNAREAAGILSAQGFGAWTEKYGRAAAAEYPLGSDAWKMLMSGGFGGSMPIDTAGGTTKRARKPRIISGAALIPSALNDEISTLADKARDAVGGAAVADLKAEAADVEKAIDAVGAHLKAGTSSKQAAAINAELTSLANKLRDLHAAIKDAAAAKAEQATIATFTSQLKAEQAANKRLTDTASIDAAYTIRTNLAGAAQVILDDFGAIGKNLVDQQNTLLGERTKLTSQLAGAGKRTTSVIKSQVTKINGQLGSVSDAILANLKSEADQLQQTVNTVSARVATAWSAVSSDIVAEFEKQTQDYITNVLGPKYFQGGLQTPAEAQLAAMQQADQVGQLNANLAAATDPAAKAAAQRAIDEYNKQIEATKERADADRNYAAEVQRYTDQRTVAEHKLVADLTVFGQGLADGKGNLDDLNGILTAAGLPNMQGLSDVAGQLFQQDFPALSSSVADLAVAMDALKKKIDEITGRDSSNDSRPPGPTGTGPDPTHTDGTGGRIPRPGGIPTVFARGGKVPGRYIGRDSVHALLAPGETVIDRRLTAALEQLVLGGNSGVGSTTINATVLGATERQVAAALERIITPAQRRVVSYPLRRR